MVRDEVVRKLNRVASCCLMIGVMSVNMLERFEIPEPPRGERRLPSFPVLLICGSLAFMPVWIGLLAWAAYRGVADGISPIVAPLIAALRISSAN